MRVEFDPPLLGYEEVKPRLLGMKVYVDSALGTVRPNPPFNPIGFLRARARARRPFLTNC